MLPSPELAYDIVDPMLRSVEFMVVVSRWSIWYGSTRFVWTNVPFPRLVVLPPLPEYGVDLSTFMNREL